MVDTCKHCGTEVVRTVGGQWITPNSNLLPQYCWVDPQHGSKLHEVVSQQGEAK